MPIEVHVLSLPFDAQGQSDFLHPVVIRQEGFSILADCGYPDMIESSTLSLASHGFHWADINAVFITHHDNGHYGTAAAIKVEYPHVEMCAPLAEQPLVEGTRNSLYLQHKMAFYRNCHQYYLLPWQRIERRGR